MPSELTLVEPVALPAQSAVATVYESMNLADAFAIQLPSGTTSDPEVLWRFLISQQPSWIGWLTNVRDAIVACFGLKTAKRLATLSSEGKADRIGIFKVYGRSGTEIVLGEDDKHLDFRLSVFCTPDLSPTLGGQLTVSTVVHCHNLLGRAYISAIAPFHRLVVKASLRRAAYIGWPKATDGGNSPDLRRLHAPNSRYAMAAVGREPTVTPKAAIGHLPTRALPTAGGRSVPAMPVERRTATCSTTSTPSVCARRRWAARSPIGYRNHLVVLLGRRYTRTLRPGDHWRAEFASMSHLRALLLTDVVDSTALSVRVGDTEMASVWVAHDRVARDLLRVWRGREIDKTDGMLLLFDTASDAVGYALAYQRALSQLAVPLKARAGLHVGLVTLRENSPSDVALGAKPIEVEGVAKATAARVMSTATGGQILLSANARQSLDTDGLRLQSHGHWHLKGLDDPLELFEVGNDGASFSPPPDSDKAYRVVRQDDTWLPVRRIRHSLPAEGDSFIGRAEALVDLSRRIQSGARLVSVLGVGGTGKTRLAMRYGRSWLGEFPGGVWFCDLAPARSIADIASAVAHGLDIPLGRDDPVVQIGNAIAGRGPCLVILDNFEQVSRFAGQTLGHWLARADQARFLVTTREVLGLPGEVVLALPPLMPADGAALFVQRAEAAKPDFRPSAEERAAIAPLVALLDGLPLAIELAAARVRVMPPRALLSRMSERFKVLASKGGRLDRQATLHAAFDWSWDLLPAPEKAALAQLSVFEGGFTLEAAEAVIDLSAWDDAPWTVDAVQALIDKSFVRSRSDGRFDLLVSVQAYAAEQLRTEGRYAGSGLPALASAQARHVAWFASLGTLRAIAGRCADLDNLATACRRAVELGSGDAAGALEGAWAALGLRGPFVVGIELAELVCALPTLDDRAAARARLALAHALVLCGHSARAREVYDSAMVRARTAGDRQCEAWTTFRLGSLHQLEGRIDDARARHLDAIRMARQLGDRTLECLAASDLGNEALIEGHMDEALSHYTRALTVAREAGDEYVQGGVLGNLGKLHLEVGRLDDADGRFTEALATARAIGHRRLEGKMLCNLGMLYLVQERLGESEVASRAALVVARDLGDLQLEAVVLCNLGIVVERQGRADEAQAQFEAAMRLARAFGDQISEGQFAGYLGLLHARQGRHDDARRSLESGEALLRSASDAFGLGVLLTSRAEAHHLAGDATAAATALAAASSIAAEVGASPVSEIGLALARVRALIDPARD